MKVNAIYEANIFLFFFNLNPQRYPKYIDDVLDSDKNSVLDF